MIPSVALQDSPTYTWISKTPTKSKNCPLLGYCLAIKIDQTWVNEYLSSIGDDVSVELFYFDSKGQLIHNGIDSVGKRIKGDLIHFPSANRSVFDPIYKEGGAVGLTDKCL